MPFALTKLAGCGNDFLLLDCRGGPVAYDPHALARALCHRRLGVGADGLVLIEPASGQANFRARLFNPDGSDAELSGNGGRCIARFAYELGIAGSPLSFETKAGLIRAAIDGAVVRLEMPEPRGLELNKTIEACGSAREVHAVDTGVPHAVLFVDDLEGADVIGLGSEIRRHGAFPRGANVDFAKIGRDRILVRTYERGVEDETLACGTGAVAAAVVSHSLGFTKPPVNVQTMSGELLTVDFLADGLKFSAVTLTGPTEIICTVEVGEEWLNARLGVPAGEKGMG